MRKGSTIMINLTPSTLVTAKKSRITRSTCSSTVTSSMKATAMTTKRRHVQDLQWTRSLSLVILTIVTTCCCVYHPIPVHVRHGDCNVDTQHVVPSVVFFVDGFVVYCLRHTHHATQRRHNSHHQHLTSKEKHGRKIQRQLSSSSLSDQSSKSGQQHEHFDVQHDHESDKRRRRRPNIYVRDLMDIIRSRLGDGDDGDFDGDTDDASDTASNASSSSSSSSFPESWKKTRNYLYKTDLRDIEETQVVDVMTFLDTELGLSKHVVRHVLQTTPRLLRRPVPSMLRPTAQFLTSLWGPERLEEALLKNPDLLLTSGLGYIPHNEKKRKANNVKKKKNDDNSTSPKKDSEGTDHRRATEFMGTISRQQPTSNERRRVDEETRPSVVVETTSVDADVAEVEMEGMNRDQYGSDDARVVTDVSSSVGGGVVYEYKNDSMEDVLIQRCEFTPVQIQRLKNASPFLFSIESNKAVAFIDFLEEILSPLFDGGTSDAKQSPSSTLLSSGHTSAPRGPPPSASTIRKIIQTHPSLVGLLVDRSLRPKIDFLSERLGGTLTDVDIAKIVERSSGIVLELSIEKNLAPTIDYLLEHVFMASSDIEIRNNVINDGNGPDRSQSQKGRIDALMQLKKCILKHPQILSLNLSNLQTKVDFFLSIGSDGDGKILASRIASKCPQVYSLSLDRIKRSVDFLSRVWGCGTIEEVQGGQVRPAKRLLTRMISEYPNVLTLSVEGNLQPTCNFYNQTGYTKLNENWELVENDDVDVDESTDATRNRKRRGDNRVRTTRIRGRHIASSLYQRLLPRWRFCSIMNMEISQEGRQLRQQQKIDDDAVGYVTEPRFPSLDLLVMADDEQFCTSLQFDSDRYAKFKTEEGPRIIFSSQFDQWLKTGRPIDLQ